MTTAAYLWPALVAATDLDALIHAAHRRGWLEAQAASVATPFPIRPEDCPYGEGS